MDGWMDGKSHLRKYVVTGSCDLLPCGGGCIRKRPLSTGLNRERPR